MRQQNRQQASRRDTLRWALASAAGLTLLGSESSAGPKPNRQASPAEAWSGLPSTTLDGTVVAGPQRVSGLPYRRLARGPAIERRVREDLCRRSTAGYRTGLAAFGQLTDSHVLDAANPGRLSFLWQYLDFSDGFPNSGRFRPHDLLTVHVLDAMVRQLNAVQQGPVSRRPLDCLVVTGDLTNSYCLSELSAAVGVFKGGSVTSHPGGGYKGVQDHGDAPTELFRNIWHPEPSSSELRRDDWKSRHGYPTVPGFLAAAIEPIASPGSELPWYVGVGNHDEAGLPDKGPLSPKTEFVDLVRVGDRLPTRLPPRMNASEFWEKIWSSDDDDRRRLLESLQSRKVEASKLRRAFSKTEFMNSWSQNGAALSLGSDTVKGSRADTYYTFDISADVMGIMLNTASPDGSTEAVLDATQADWLEKRLRLFSGKFYDENGRLITARVEDRLIVLFSHHPLSSFDQDEPASDDDPPPLNRPEVVNLIARFPNVIAWMNGHSHRHRVTPHRAPDNDGGFWEITTASLIDFPQQSRIVEIVDNGDGTLSIGATLVDHSAPESVAYEGVHTSASLAALSLELSINRPGLDHDAVMGNSGDQNVDLLVRKPF